MEEPSTAPIPALIEVDNCNMILTIKKVRFPKEGKLSQADVEAAAALKIKVHLSMQHYQRNGKWPSQFGIVTFPANVALQFSHHS